MINREKLEKLFKLDGITKELGISYPTLIKRLSDNKWKEIQIEKLKSLGLWITK